MLSALAAGVMATSPALVSSEMVVSFAPGKDTLSPAEAARIEQGLSKMKSVGQCAIQFVSVRGEPIAQGNANSKPETSRGMFLDDLFRKKGMSLTFNHAPPFGSPLAENEMAINFVGYQRAPEQCAN